MLRQRAASRPEHDALIAGDRRVSYGELWDKVVSTACMLVDEGVQPGDRVLLAAASRPAFAFGYLGTHLAGATAVPLDPAAPAARRDDLIRRSRPKLSFGTRADSLPELGEVRAIDELESLPAAKREFAPVSLDSPADLLFTTGTSGKPKGVRLRHRHLVAAATHINSVIQNGEQDIEVVPLPLNHSFGLARLRCNILAGGTVVLTEGFKMPGEIFAALDKHSATGLVGVPAGFAVLLRFGKRGLGPFADRIRYIEIGSAAMRQDQKQQLISLLPDTRIWMHYGLTEASRSAFIEFHRHADRLDTIGTPSPGVEIQIRSKDGAVLGHDEPGLLWIRGPHVADGYWEDPELSATTFEDGWIKTGDVAELSADGFIKLHGRRDDMMNVGGFNVSPIELEAILAKHPAIAEAACIGVPDPRKIAAQVVKAYLVATSTAEPPGEHELSQFVGEQLEAYKVPTQYEWIDSLPKSGSGKLLRARLRERAASDMTATPKPRTA